MIGLLSRINTTAPGYASTLRALDPNEVNAPAAKETMLLIVDLDTVDGTQFEEALSEDEQARAARYRCELDRTRFITRRGLLRQWLARWVGMVPSDLRFDSNPHGKPALAVPCSAIKFSVSHSGSLGAFAFTQEYDVGVDIELLRMDIDAVSLAEKFLPARDAKEIRAATAPEKAILFLQHWTRMEAITKMRGDGLTDAESSQCPPASAWPHVNSNVFSVSSLAHPAVVALATAHPISNPRKRCSA
jgi:4'-phosphopantetheinyl transferase